MGRKPARPAFRRSHLMFQKTVTTTKPGEESVTRVIVTIESPVVENLFTYHAPTPDDIVGLKNIREAAKDLAYVFHENCPPSADRTAAMRLLQDAVQTANRSIALRGVSYR